MRQDSLAGDTQDKETEDLSSISAHYVTLSNSLRPNCAKMTANLGYQIRLSEPELSRETEPPPASIGFSWSCGCSASLKTRDCFHPWQEYSPANSILGQQGTA